MKRHVRHVLKDENPTIWIGKDGLTAQSVAEIEKQLQQNKMVKIRILPAALKELTTAEEIAARLLRKLRPRWSKLGGTFSFCLGNAGRLSLKNPKINHNFCLLIAYYFLF
jgi:RNA-binding protein YhbY